MIKLIMKMMAFGCIGFLTACGGAWWDSGDTSGIGNYKIMTLARGNRTLFKEYAAALNGRQSVEIRPQISGTITQIWIDEGASVRKGQTLFVIDQVPYRAALETAEANVRSAEATVATARLTVESKRELYREKVVSAFDLQTAENALLEAEALLAQAEAQRTNARNDLSYTTVKSPANGVIGMLPYRVGALVSSTITEPLCTVSDAKEVHAYFSISEKEMIALMRENGTSDRYMTRMQAVALRLADDTPYACAGRIDAVSGTVDRRTGAVALRATFPNPDGLLRNGGSGTVVIPFDQSGVLVIPQEATFEIQDKIFVYKVIDSKTAATEIEVFPVDDGKEYIVQSGLSEGDRIVAAGAGLVREGTFVADQTTEKEEQP